MNKNEKTAAGKSDGLTKLKHYINFTPRYEKPQVLNCGNQPPRITTTVFDGQNSTVPFFEMTSFVCDECCLPLWLYGANFIESYTIGRANILRCLCDNHAEAFGFLEVAE